MDKVGFWRNLALLLILLITAFIGYSGLKPTSPVCHAKTEDSVISDCDYHNGAWWTK